MLTNWTAGGASFLITAACVFAACEAAAQSGVAMVGDMQSIDRAVVESAALPLPSFDSQPPASRPAARAAGSQPLPIDGVRQVAAQLPVQADPPKPAKKRPTLFGSLKKPSWLFGGDSDKQSKPATDPFAAAAKPVAPQGAAPIPTQSVGQNGVRVAAYQPRGAQPATSKPSNRPTARRAGSSTGRSGGIATRESSSPQRGLFSGWFGGDKHPTTKSQTTTPPRVAARVPASPAVTRIPTTVRSPLAPPTAPQRVVRTSPTVGSRTGAKPLPPSAAAEPLGVVMISDAPKQAPNRAGKPLAQHVPLPPSPASQGLADKVATLRSPLAKLPIAETSITTKPASPKTAAVATAAPKGPAMPEKSLAKPETAVSPLAIVEKLPLATPVDEPIATAEGPQRIDVAASLAMAGDLDPDESQSEPAKPSISADLPVVVDALPLPAANPASTSRPAPSSEPAIATDSIVVIDTGDPKPLTVYNNVREADAPPSDRSQDLLREAHTLAGDAATEGEFDAIIKRCRYVLAIDRSREAIAYANQLAAWALNKRGELNDDAGRYGQAEADFLDAVAADPECWRAEHRLGVQAARRGDFAEARRRFDRSLRVHPEHAKALSNRAAIELAEGDLPAALADYRRALEIDPDLPSAHLGCGRVCHMTERYAEGLRHLDAAEVLSPGDAAVAAARGDLLSDLGRYAQARDAYGRAISLDPQSPTAYRNLAWLLATCPQPEHRDGAEAVAHADRAEQLIGKADDLTLDTRAAALATDGRFDEAAETQRRAIELAPPMDAAAYRERLSLYERGEAFYSQPSGVRQASYSTGPLR